MSFNRPLGYLTRNCFAQSRWLGKADRGVGWLGGRGGEGSKEEVGWRGGGQGNKQICDYILLISIDFGGFSWHETR